MAEFSPPGELVRRGPVLAEQRPEFGAECVAVGSPDHLGIDRKGRKREEPGLTERNYEGYTFPTTRLGFR